MDVLERTRETAIALARRITSGGPLGNWTEAEVVLATLLLFYTDPSRLGGTKQTKTGPRQHPAVTAVARAIGRTEDAVVLKVMNLRAVLTGGERGMDRGAKKLEHWAIEAFRDHLDDLVAAAMEVASLVPGAADVLEIVGPVAGEVPRAASAADVPAAPPVAGDAPPPITTALREVAVRRGQGLFRSRVMANYVHACALCGLGARRPASNTFFLLAGHILPWKDASHHQRLDPRNGLALCALHDRAFEWGFVGLDETLRVVVSPAVREHYEPENLVEQELLGLQGRPLRRDALAFEEPGSVYLAHHRERVFERRFREGNTGGCDASGACA